MPQEDYGASELNHPEEIFRVILPADDDAAIVMKPSEQAFDFPAAAVTSEHATVLRHRFAAVPAVRRDQLHAQSFLQASIERVAVVGFVADQSRRSFLEEPSLEGGFDERDFIGPSAGQVHGDRKTMAVCNCHDFTAFPALGGTHCRAPFFAPLKLASMNDSLRSSLPRSRKSSASFCSKCVSFPERSHCWKRR